MADSRYSLWKSDVALLFAILVWGINFAIIKAALEVMSPHVMNVFRLSVSAVVLGMMHARFQRRQKASFFAPLKTHGLQIAGLGIMGFFVYQFFFIVGLDNTLAGNAALIMGSAPLWTALLASLLRYEKLSRLSWGGLLVSMVGTALVLLFGTKQIGFEANLLFGNLIVLGASLMWGAYTALTRPILRHVSPIGLTFLGLLFALPFLYAVAIPSWGEVHWSEVDDWVWLAILFSGGLSTGIATALWNNAIKYVGPSHTAAFGNLVPFVALLSSVLLLDEPILSIQLVGGALLIGGLFLMRRGRPKQSPVSPHSGETG